MYPPNCYAQRDRHWPAVLKIFGAFSNRHLQGVLILCHDLGLQCSDDGLPRHMLARQQDIPLLDQHFWLLDDWAIADSPHRQTFEKHFFIAAAFTFLAAKTQTARLDPHSFFDDRHQSLEDELWRQAGVHWLLIFDVSSPFWPHYQHARAAAFPPDAPADALIATGHWAFASLPAIAVALWVDKAALIPQLIHFSEHCRAALQIVDNLATFRRDLKNGLITHPIQRALAAMGATPAANTSVETALAALLLAGMPGKLMKENEARIIAARGIATGLNMPVLQAYCAELDKLMARVPLFFSPAVTPAGQAAARAFFVPAPDVLGNVLLKAEAYLLADLTFREAWDIQQNSHGSAPQMIGKTFPPCLIIDILCQHGHDLSEVADGVLKTLRADGFRYWSLLDRLVPDADTIGLGMRLIPHASDPEGQRARFQTPLRWIREHQRPGGQIPVWFRNHDSPPYLSDIAVLYGADCATVETNLLVSLIGADWHAYRDVIEACARNWCQRWLAVGLAACEHYTPLYSLWAGAELIARLAISTADEALKAQLHAAGACINERLSVEAQRVDLSPQDAAFLTLASLRTRALPFNPAWITILFKHQRCDGCWEGEPIYITPTARSLTTNWFKSRTMTTAFAYHALKHYHAHS